MEQVLQTLLAVDKPKTSNSMRGRVTAAPLETMINHNPFFPLALTLAHLALAVAASLALTAGLERRSFLAGLGVDFWAFNLADRIFRALARALISLRRWAAVMWYLRLAGAEASTGDGVGTSPPPPPEAIDSISPCSASICSLMAIMRWSCPVVNSAKSVMGDGLMPAWVWSQSRR